jgi:hypothetical protein
MIYYLVVETALTCCSRVASVRVETTQQQAVSTTNRSLAVVPPHGGRPITFNLETPVRVASCLKERLKCSESVKWPR